jgi:hypothetical protein
MSRITVKAKPRGNRNYRNGRRAEYEARDLLKAEGYSVMRAAGSKGAADLVGVREGGKHYTYGADGFSAPTVLLDVVWVSVKRGTGRADKAQRARLAELPGRREVWSRQRGGAWIREVV